MKLNDLVQHISHTGASETDITAITYDSRKACAGSLFVCLVGAWLDGHTYAESAYQNGCRAFLVEHRVDLPADAVQIVTDDTRAALAILKEDDLIDREFDGFVRKLITYMMEDPRTISASLDLLFLAKAIERIGDHSKNVAELIIYLVKGKDVRHTALTEIESAVL